MKISCLKGRIIQGAYKFHAIITTFEMILTDCPELRNIKWRCVIIDEAHRLKNRNCKLLEGLKLMDLVSMYFAIMNCVLLMNYDIQFMMFDIH